MLSGHNPHDPVTYSSLTLVSSLSHTKQHWHASLYVQAECLLLPDVLLGANLVFGAPTSAGKTVVYEILALRRLITTGKPFMLVLPTVALCKQKVRTYISTQGFLNIRHTIQTMIYATYACMRTFLVFVLYTRLLK